MEFWAVTVLVVAIGAIVSLSFVGGRLKIINASLHDLYALLAKIDSNRELDLHYAINENIVFYKATRTVPTYVWWLLVRAFKIQKDKLLEIADFPLPRWQEDTHRRLVELEKRNVPGLLKPLTAAAVEYGSRCRRTPAILLDVGCGGMEAARQIAVRWKKRFPDRPLVFIGLDATASNYKIAKKSFPAIVELPRFNAEVLGELSSRAAKEGLAAGMHIADVFDALSDLPDRSVDIAFHSRLKHHIPSPMKHAFDTMIARVADVVIENDDTRSPYQFIGPSIFAWNKPSLLNGAIISGLRDPSISDLKEKKDGWEVKIFRGNGYLRIKSSV